MPVTVTRNFTALADIKLTNQELMREVGLLARERIVRRTREGLDASGVPFAPYSTGYALLKAAALGPGRVNLQVSGDMLNSIAITEVTDTSVTLGFTR